MHRQFETFYPVWRNFILGNNYIQINIQVYIIHVQCWKILWKIQTHIGSISPNFLVFVIFRTGLWSPATTQNYFLRDYFLGEHPHTSGRLLPLLSLIDQRRGTVLFEHPLESAHATGARIQIYPCVGLWCGCRAAVWYATAKLTGERRHKKLMQLLVAQTRGYDTK